MGNAVGLRGRSMECRDDVMAWGEELDGHVLPPLNPPCVSGGVRVIFEVQDGVVPEEESDSPPLDDEGLILLMIDPAVSCLPYHLLDGADDPPLML